MSLSYQEKIRTAQRENQTAQTNMTIKLCSMEGRCGGEIMRMFLAHYLAKDFFLTDRKMYLALIRMVSCCFCPSSTPLLVASLCQFCVVFL